MTLTRTVNYLALSTLLLPLAAFGDAQQQLPPPTPVPTAAHRALTHQDFAAAFQPAEGRYEVELLHPKTCCPVNVCFCLPCGCPRKVHVHKYSLTYDYGRERVTIRFKLNGDVHVNYH
jgi:hypothetical protein